MATRILHVLLRLALLLALVGSTALFLDYSGAAPAFCGGAGGCAAVKQSAFSHIGGVSVPTIGLAAFVLMFAGSLVVETRAQAEWLAAFLALGALCALGFIGIQLFVVRAVCRWCMLVDVSAVVAAVTASFVARREPDGEPWPLRCGWFAAGVVAILAPWSWGGAAVATVDLAPSLAALQHEDVADLLMFTDFQCPYCRKFHAIVHARVAENPTKFKLVRFMVPLSVHVAADPAARAYVCAPEALKEPFADELYQMDMAAFLGEEGRPLAVVQTLVEDHIIGFAGALGLERAAFQVCMGAPETKQKVADDMALFQSLQLLGLPTTFIDNKRLVGGDAKAFEQALVGHDLRAMYGLLALVWVGAAGASLFGARKKTSTPGASGEEGATGPVAEPGPESGNSDGQDAAAPSS